MEISIKKKQLHIGRQTKTKKAIVDILSKNCCLLHKNELIEEIKKQKITPNRSTIYRELKTLEKNDFISKSTILGNDYYEILQDHHHHHIICLKCNKIESFNACKYNLIVNEIKNKIHGFAEIKNHSFELFGICNYCNKK